MAGKRARRGWGARAATPPPKSEIKRRKEPEEERRKMDEICGVSNGVEGRRPKDGETLEVERGD